MFPLEVVPLRFRFMLCPMACNSKCTNLPSSTGCIAIIIIVLLSSELCKGQGDSPDLVSPLVAGGEPASRGRFPYMCSIRKRGTGRHVCGGTLIDKQWVMTAAHCLDPENPDSAGMSPFLFCSIYEREEQDASKRFTPSRCYLHHLWDGKVRNGDDIALCRLDTFATVAIPDLSNIGDDYTRSDEFSVLGWGQTSSRGSLADILQIGEGLRYVLPSACNIVEEWAGNITNSMMCAGFVSPNTCRGDSGGPLFIRHDPSAANIPEDPLLDLIVGITSFGLTDCEADAPGVYTRVSCYRLWINCIMEGTEQDCSVYSPCDEDSSSPSTNDPSLCSGVQKSATFDEADALRRMTTAITSDDSITMKKLLCDGLSPNAVQGAYNESLLIRAAQYNAIQSARVLLEHGADLEYKNRFGQAALSKAAGFGSASVAQLLIDKEADIETSNNQGWTPLAHAAFYVHFRVAEILVNAGAEIESKANMGHTPLHNAAQKNSFEIAELLIKNGANIESKTEKGFTPLHLAAEYNSVEVAKDLIANGADIQAKNNWGYSPLHIAAYNGALNALHLMLDENAIVDAPKNDGWTPLHVASSRGYISIVRVKPNVNLSTYYKGCI